jgi:hypothetical protein
MRRPCRPSPGICEPMVTRRTATLLLAALFSGPVRAAPPAAIRVTKDPNCGCCEGWVAHLRQEGFDVTVTATPRMSAVKARLGVPPELWSCHTAQLEHYVLEGHVPAPAIQRLLAERPDALGLAVPGMPVGSPGMEVEGSPPEEYAVVLYGAFGQRDYARFKGAVEIGR